MVGGSPQLTSLQCIKFAGYDSVYTYTTDGTKLQVVDKTAPDGVTIPVTNLDTVLTNPLVLSTITTDYVGDAIYRNDTLLRILLPTGYYQGGKYYYYLKDHLGSNRVVLNSSGTVVESSSYYPSGMRFGESAVNGGNVQPYRHTGMEMQGMHGLNWIDNKARMRTVNVPEFTTMDPLAEKYYSVSPYAYVEDNPVRFVDKDGRDEWNVNDKGKIVKHIVTKKYDAFYRVNDKGERLKGQSLAFKYGTVKYSAYSTVVKENGSEKVVNLNIFEVKGDKNASSIYKFVAGSKQEDNSTAKTVEWGKFQITSKHSPYNNMVGTGNNPGTEYSTPEMLQNIMSAGDKIRDFTHSHPDASGVASPPDIDMFKYIRKWNNKDAKMHIYTPDDGKYTPY